jgi:hypothetical protein
MTVQAHVDPEILQTWPAYQAAVVIAQGVRNGPTDEASEALLSSAEQAARESGLGRAADDPRIAAGAPSSPSSAPSPAAIRARPSRCSPGC